MVASFALPVAEERVALLTRITTKISYGMLPVVGWVERRRPPETADLVRRRLFGVLNEAVGCAAYDIPEYAGGVKPERASRGQEGLYSDGAYRTATLAVSAIAVADLLHGWADDIEREEGKDPPVSFAIKQLAEDIRQDQKLELQGKTTRQRPNYQRLYDLKKNNPVKYQQAIDYLNSLDS